MRRSVGTVTVGMFAFVAGIVTVLAPAVAVGSPLVCANWPSRMAGGRQHSLALTEDGRGWSWGSNSNGQLGLGVPAPFVSIPKPIPQLDRLIAVAAGEFHSLAVRDDGTAWAWGENGDGQLGDGSGFDKDSPVQVSSLTGVVAVAAGSGHSLALDKNRAVWAWGRNDWGQLGDGTWLPRFSPVRVSGLTDVIAIAAGHSHSLAVRGDGTAWAWGANSAGQLGDGTGNQSRVPVQVGGSTMLTGVTAVAAGNLHSLARLGDGTVWAWGANHSGQLGDGTSTEWRLAPVQVSGLTGIRAVSAGYSHSLAVRRSTPFSPGSLWAWGRNGERQLGDGTNEKRTSPVQVLFAQQCMDDDVLLPAGIAGLTCAETGDLNPADAGHVTAAMDGGPLAVTEGTGVPARSVVLTCTAFVVPSRNATYTHEGVGATDSAAVDGVDAGTASYLPPTRIDLTIGPEDTLYLCTSVTVTTGDGTTVYYHDAESGKFLANDPTALCPTGGISMGG